MKFKTPKDLKMYYNDYEQEYYLKDDVDELFSEVFVRIERLYEGLNELELHKVEENMKELYELKNDLDNG